MWHFNSSKEWNAIYPSAEDVKLLVSTAFYSDIVVNVGSTMAFDFSMFNKPCVFINYEQQNKKVKDWSIKTIYQFQHFRSMLNKNAVIWLDSKDEIVEKLTLDTNCSPVMVIWRAIVLEDYKNSSVKIKEIINTD